MTPLIPKPINLAGESSESGSSYHIKRLLPRHYKMLELHLAGVSNKAIAETVGCTPQSVSIVIRSPMFKSELQRRMADQTESHIAQEADAFASLARTTLEQASERAAQTQVELLDSEDDSVKLRSSSSILDRVLGKVEGVQASGGPSVKVEIQTKDAQLLILALNESKEITHAQRHTEEGSVPDGPSAGPSENGQGDVHQDPSSSAGI